MARKRSARNPTPAFRKSGRARVVRGYADLREHLDELRRRGLLLAIDRPIDKDAELHPLVRWQYVGGVEEQERKAFLFTHVVDGRGRRYRFPVVVGAYAGSRAIYCAGMRAAAEEVEARWARAIANPVPPRIVSNAACQEVVIEGRALQGEGNGLDMLPIPVSTPGFDGAPTLTATNVITKDPRPASRIMERTAPASRRRTGWSCAWRRVSVAPEVTATISSTRSAGTRPCRARSRSGPALHGVRGADEVAARSRRGRRCRWRRR
jgi:hypothetical protein